MVVIEAEFLDGSFQKFLGRHQQSHSGCESLGFKISWSDNSETYGGI